MIKVNFINDTSFVFNKDIAEKTTVDTLNRLGIREELIVEVMLVGEDEIRALNKTYRKIDKPTDVLSFPQTQIKSSKINIFGSIVICPKVAKEKEEELIELIKHGLLHLAGFDHEADQARWDEAAKQVSCMLPPPPAGSRIKRDKVK